MFTKTLAVISVLNFAFLSPMAMAQEADINFQKEKMTQTLRPLEGKLNVTDEAGKAISMNAVFSGQYQDKGVVFHVPKENIHILIKAKPTEDSKISVFMQMMDQDNNPTAHFTMVSLDAKQDPAVINAILDDAARVLISDPQSALKNVFTKDMKKVALSSDIGSMSRKPTASIEVGRLVLGVVITAVGVYWMGMVVNSAIAKRSSAFQTGLVIIVCSAVAATGASMVVQSIQ